MWRKIRLPLGLMTFAVAVFGLYLAGKWPGLFYYDSFTDLANARAQYLNVWVSYVYSGYLILLTWLCEDPGFVGIVQILIAATSMSLFTTWALRRSRPQIPVLASFACFVLFPPNGMMNIFYSRDWLFSWLLCGLAVFFAFVIFTARERKSRIGLWALATLMGWASLTALTRTDGLPLVFILPAMVALLAWRFKWRLNWKDGGVVLLFIGLTLWCNERWTELHRPVTAMMNPMSYLLRNHYVTADPEADRQIIDRVVDFKLLSELYDDYEIPAFHAGAVRPAFTMKDLSELERLYVRMIWDNKTLFLKNRLTMMDGLMGNSRTFYYTDALSDRPANSESVRKSLGISREPLSETLDGWVTRILFAVFPSDSPIQYILLASAWLPLLLNLGFLFSFRKFPICAAASALVLYRIPIVVLTAPAAQFKYVYSLYLFAFFLVPLAYVERGLGSGARRS